jgi:hypothetical protein
MTTMQELYKQARDIADAAAALTRSIAHASIQEQPNPAGGLPEVDHPSEGDPIEAQKGPGESAKFYACVVDERREEPKHPGFWAQFSDGTREWYNDNHAQNAIKWRRVQKAAPTVVTSEQPSRTVKDNWVNKMLDNATRVVAEWPEWMRRPELRMPGSHGAAAQSCPPTVGPSAQAPTKCQCHLEAGDSECPVHDCPSCGGEHNCERCKKDGAWWTLPDVMEFATTPARNASVASEPAEITTENLDAVGTFDPMGIKQGGAMMDYVPERQGHWLPKDPTRTAARNDIRANIARATAEKDRTIAELRERAEKAERELDQLRTLRKDCMDALQGEAGNNADDCSIVSACSEWSESVRMIPEEMLDPEVDTLQEGVSELLNDIVELQEQLKIEQDERNNLQMLRARDVHASGDAYVRHLEEIIDLKKIYQAKHDADQATIEAFRSEYSAYKATQDERHNVHRKQCDAYKARIAELEGEKANVIETSQMRSQRIDELEATLQRRTELLREGRSPMVLDEWKCRVRKELAGDQAGKVT